MAQFKTSFDDEHQHNAEVDDNGNGKTISTSDDHKPHVHAVIRWKVQTKNKHKHKINRGK